MLGSTHFDTELATDIERWLGRYVELPSEAHMRVASKFVLHTWTFEAFHVTPYLYVYSNKPASGKTRFLELLSILCRSARRADDMTPSVMFKLISRESPTLLLDEIDTVWAGSRNDPKRRIMCTGYKKGGSAWREQARELIEFQTFCAKVLCGINNGFMPETVRSRCIPFEMQRKTKLSKVERFNEHQVASSPEVDNLLDRIMRFREDFMADITAQRPLPMTELSDRQDEIVEPLLAIAGVLGTEQQLREDLRSIFAGAATSMPDPRQQILRRIRAAFEIEGRQERVSTEFLCDCLGNSFNGRNLALWLEPFGIAPQDLRFGNQVLKGYLRQDFQRVWEIYLEPDAEVHNIDEGRKEVA